MSSSQVPSRSKSLAKESIKPRSKSKSRNKSRSSKKCRPANITYLNARRYRNWDKAFEDRKPDYTFLAVRLSAMGTPGNSSPDAEFLWRKSAVTLSSIYALDWTTETDLIITKAAIAQGFATRAIQDNPNSFGANLWMAKCMAPLLMVDIGRTINNDAQLHCHLGIAASAEPNNWRILLLQSQMKAGLHEHIIALNHQPGSLPKPVDLQYDLVISTVKLRHALQLNGHSHEIYLSLALLLYMQREAAEAVDIALEGTRLVPVNKGEEYLVSMLKRFKQLVDDGKIRKTKAKKSTCCCIW